MLVPPTFICAVTNSVQTARATREKHTSISHADRNDDGDDDDMITVRKAFKAFISRVRVSAYICDASTLYHHMIIIMIGNREDHTTTYARRSTCPSPWGPETITVISSHMRHIIAASKIVVKTTRQAYAHAAHKNKTGN